MLASHAGGNRDLTVEAGTVREALSTMRDAVPGLRPLLDDEGGHRRHHVKVFYNEVQEDAIDDPGRAASDGDEILVIQSVSGG
jgi:molybdopterin converting factor small subunit